jgi:hypothetical protein
MSRSAMYNSAFLTRVPRAYFCDLPTAKDMDLDTMDARTFYMYEDTCFSWEHTRPVDSSYTQFYLNTGPYVHAWHDLRVHVPGVTDSVVMVIGDTALPLTRMDGNYWLLKTFTKTLPFLPLPMHAQPELRLGPQQMPSDFTLSFCCIHLAEQLRDDVEDDCYMDGPGNSKFIFTAAQFTRIHDADADADWAYIQVGT